MKRGIGWLAGLLVAAAGITSGAPLYVAETGDDGNNGSTWELAKRTIQGALTASGSPIYVSNGTYKATGNQVVSVTKTVDIQGVGGYSNTFIDGENARRGVYIRVTSGGPVTLSGFTIQNCWTNLEGGGIRVEGSQNVTISDCRVMNNVSSKTEGAGGGVYKLSDTGTLTLTNCIIVSNRASVGYGGGIFSYYGKVYVYNCEIISNMAGAGGGLAAGGSGAVQAFDCRSTLIAYNTASSYGGGVYSECGLSGSPSILDNCRIISNFGTSSGGGVRQRGGIYPGHLIVRNCEIRKNSAASGYGGGLALCGGMQMRSTLISENTAQSVGGGICFYNGGVATNRVVIENATIASNAAIGAAGSYGGGIMWYSNVSNVTLVNSIIFNNTQQGNYAGRTNIYISAGCPVLFTNCCVAPLTGVVGADNTDKDPQFQDLAGGNCRLKALSPCVNTGLNQEWMDAALDRDGHSRLDRFSRRVDMGAFEQVPAGVLLWMR